MTVTTESPGSPSVGWQSGPPVASLGAGAKGRDADAVWLWAEASIWGYMDFAKDEDIGSLFHLSANGAGTFGAGLRDLPGFTNNNNFVGNLPLGPTCFPSESAQLG